MKKFLYFIYYIKYKFTHEKGMTPACYNEWLDLEYVEMKKRGGKNGVK